MTKVLMMLAVPAMLAIVPAAHAQNAEGPAAFGKCAVDADRTAATALLATKVGSGESKSAAKKLADKNGACGAIIGRDRGEEIVRGASARQVYTETYAAAPAALAGDPAPFQGSGDPNLVQYDLARCAVTRDPVAADALVRTGEGSAEERAALPAVVNAVGRCTPGSAKVGFSKAQLRAGVAEGRWVYCKGSAAQ